MAEWSWGNRRVDSGSGGLLSRAVLLLAQQIEEENDRWFLWVPVCFGAGIGLYFALPAEPASYSVIAALCITLSLCLATTRIPFFWTICVAFFCASLGFANAKLRTYSVTQPALERSCPIVQRYSRPRLSQLTHGHFPMGASYPSR